MRVGRATQDGARRATEASDLLDIHEEIFIIKVFGFVRGNDAMYGAAQTGDTATRTTSGQRADQSTSGATADQSEIGATAGRVTGGGERFP